MEWQNAQRGGNIEDRRPEPFEIDSPYLGKIQGIREGFTNAVRNLTPVTLNTQCHEKIEQAYAFNKFMESSIIGRIPFTNDAAAFFHPLKINRLDLLAPNSCKMKLAAFFEYADTKRMYVDYEKESQGNMSLVATDYKIKVLSSPFLSSKGPGNIP